MGDCHITIQMAAELQGAANVGAGNQLRSSVAEVSNLDSPQLGSFLRVDQVINSGAPTANSGFCGFAQN
tara:strand:+ start:261 stop:467 length:207 start_codon:yes stop_codon:yes gene_type:complete